ncbi:hypothetical protein F9947_06460 [Burkholderia thailandensis]|nr:hypothetical protein [Burkholderia thailandensis]
MRMRIPTPIDAARSARSACEAGRRPVDRRVGMKLFRNEPACGAVRPAALQDAKNRAIGLIDAGGANDQVVAPEGGLPVRGEEIGWSGHALMLPRARPPGY